MFNFGFGDVIDRLEKHFGLRVTKFVLGVLAVSAVLLVVGVTFQQVVFPLGSWIYGVLTGSPAYADARNGISWVATIFWLVFIVAFVVTIMQFRYQFVNFVHQQERAEHAVDRVEKFQSALRRVLKEHPDDAGPHVLKMLDELTADDAEADKKLGPTRKLLSTLPKNEP